MKVESNHERAKQPNGEDGLEVVAANSGDRQASDALNREQDISQRAQAEDLRDGEVGVPGVVLDELQCLPVARDAVDSDVGRAQHRKKQARGDPTDDGLEAAGGEKGE